MAQTVVPGEAVQFVAAPPEYLDAPVGDQDVRPLAEGIDPRVENKLLVIAGVLVEQHRDLKFPGVARSGLPFQGLCDVLRRGQEVLYEGLERPAVGRPSWTFGRHVSGSLPRQGCRRTFYAGRAFWLAARG